MKTDLLTLKTTSLILLLTASLANAVDFRWIGSPNNTDFLNTANWQGGSLPMGGTSTELTIASGDKVLMDGGGGATASNLGGGSASQINISSGAKLTLDGGGWGNIVDAKVNLAPGGTIEVLGNGDAKRISHVALSGTNSTNNTLITTGRFDIREGANTLDFGNNNTLNKSGGNGLNLAGSTNILGTGTFNMTEGFLSLEFGVNWPAAVNINASNGSTITSWAGGITGGSNSTIAANINLSSDAVILGRYRDDGKTYSGIITLSGVGRFHPQVNNNNGETGSIDQWINTTGKVTGSGTLLKEGPGTLVLANTTNDYSGGTTVSSGTIDATNGVIAAGKVITAPGTEIKLGSNGVQLTDGSFIQGKVTGPGPVKLVSGTSQIAPATPADVPNLQLAGGNLTSGALSAVFSINPVQVTATSKVLLTNQTLSLQIEGNNLDGSNHGAGPDVNSAFTPGSPIYSNNGTQNYGFVEHGKTNIAAIDSTGKPYGNFWRASYYGKIINTGTTNIDISFGEQYDDQARVRIDGVDALNDGGWEVATSTSNRVGQPGINSNGTISITPGSHDIIIQSYDGWGGAGPHSGWNKGIGWRLGGYAITTPNSGGGSNAGTQADNAAFQKIDTLNTLHPNLKFSDNMDRAVNQAFNVQASGTLDIDSSALFGGASTVVTGPITGAGAVTTNGNVVIATATAHSGQTTVNAGTLRADVGGTGGSLAGSGPVVVNNGGTLLVKAVDGLGYFNNVGTNSVTVNEGGSLVTATNGRNSVDRNLNIVGGTVGSQTGPFDNGASYTLRDVGNGTPNLYNFTSSSSGTPATLSASNIGLNGAATLTVTDGPGAVDLNITGNFVDNFGAGELKKAGNGVALLATPAAHTGGTVVNAGTLLLGSSGVLPDAGALTLNGGTLATGGNDEVVGALGITANSILDLGSGTGSEVTFASVSSWTGILSIWNYSGAVWTLGNDKLVFTASSGIDLNKVQFYTDAGVTPVGVGGGFIGNELVPVPETTGALASLLLLGSLAYRERRSLLHFRK
jgi:fibronectin-binding autotransporter adhesin